MTCFKPSLVVLVMLGLVFLYGCHYVRAVGRPWDVDTDWSYKSSTTEEPGAVQLNPKGKQLRRLKFRVQDVANLLAYYNTPSFGMTKHSQGNVAYLGYLGPEPCLNLN